MSWSRRYIFLSLNSTRPFVSSHTSGVIKRIARIQFLIQSTKDIVDLAMSPIHTEESICYLESLISEYRSRFLEAFPQQKLRPKHHFLEHYPQLIREFGPVAALWTMRFEANIAFLRESSGRLVASEISCCPLQTNTNSWKHTMNQMLSIHHSQSQKQH